MVAIIHSDATLSPTKLQLVAPWVAQQRWFTNKGRVPRLARLSAFRFEDPAGEVGLEVMFLRDLDDPSGTTYQVPVTYRNAEVPGAEEALIGTMDHSVLGKRWVYDAPHDDVFAEMLLRTMASGGRQADRSDGLVEMQVKGQPLTFDGDVEVSESHVMRGEQSNTSIVYTLADGQQLIVKIFRVLNVGANPDIEVTGALTQGGNTHVPALKGSLHGTFRAGRHSREDLEADLAFAQEFMPGVRDAWREALESARAGSDFADSARELGRTTASVHKTLAETLPTAEADEDRISALLEEMTHRAEAAYESAPALAEHRDAVSALQRKLADKAWPKLQRIHGDYHLGQVLDVPNRGWVLLDFEGEPLRPLAERSQPDCTVRDVAGMLRSFDYAGGTIEQENAGESRRDWVEATQSAFLDGYESELGTGIDRDFLDAFTLDKALYEVVYEARNRPAWLTIPTGAVSRLLSTTPEATTPEASAPAAERTLMSDTTNASGSSPELTPVHVDSSEITALVNGEHSDPHRILGAHVNDGVTTFRAVRPMARAVTVVMGDERITLTHEQDGVWVGASAGNDMPDYRIETTYEDGTSHTADDPYRFMPTLGEVDIHLIGEGRHEQLWTVLGAHVRTYPSIIGEVTGTSFAVWAPNAKAVRVVGDFNHWDGVGHAMRRLGESGIWELFIPDVREGANYKFDILCSDGVRRSKADPMARLAETAPATASKVTSSAYEWNDADWMKRRAETDPHSGPMSTYEVHLGSWRQHHSYRDLAEHLVNYVKDLGFTHVEFMPVMEHPYPPSWGYHVTSYYAPNSRFGDPDDFKFLIDRLHQEGIGVILDWVPGHFATDEWALARFDGQALYEHPNPRRGWHPEWGSNIFDYGRPQVRNFLVANALYWLEEFHTDGLRVDGVASMLYLNYARKDGEWEPNKYGGQENLEAVQLLQETNATAYKRTPGAVIIAEESTSWPGITRPTDGGGLGFGLKWNMGWMHDALDYFAREPVYRQYHHNDLTFALTYAFSENFVLPISHDEVVHGKGSLLRKMPGDRWQQLANVRAFLGYQWAHPGKQLLFMGSEFAQEAEWADGRSLDWWLLDQPAHYGVHALTKDLNRVYREHEALWALDHASDGFQWLNADDAGRNAYTWLRFAKPEADGYRPVVAVAVNLAGQPHEGVRIGLPHGGTWNELVNTDAAEYGGSGVGNFGSVEAEAQPWDGQPYSAVITMPPLGVVYFAPATRPDMTSPQATANEADSVALAQPSADADTVTPREAHVDEAIGSGEVEGATTVSTQPQGKDTVMSDQNAEIATEGNSAEELLEGAPLSDAAGNPAATDEPVAKLNLTGTPDEGLRTDENYDSVRSEDPDADAEELRESGGKGW